MTERVPSLEESTSDQRLLRLYHYWNGRRGSRRFPGRDNISPVDFKYALGRVSVIEIHRGPLRFYHRLVATRFTAHLGYEMTGKYVDDIPELAMREFLRAFYELALERRAPFHETGKVLIGNRKWWHETLSLPLASDGENVDMLLIYRETLPPDTVIPTNPLG